MGDDDHKTSFKNSVSGNIVTDGAGVEWKWDGKTRWWWWWSPEDGKWEGSGLAWTPLTKFNRTPLLKRGARQQSDDSDLASDSGASSLSTAPSCSWPMSKEKVALPKQRDSVWTKKLVVSALPDSLASAPASAPDPPAPVEQSSAEVPTEPEVQSLKDMVETIRGQLGLDVSLTVSQVVNEANLQLEKPAEGNLATQVKSLLRELIQA